MICSQLGHPKSISKLCVTNECYSGGGTSRGLLFLSPRNGAYDVGDKSMPGFSKNNNIQAVPFLKSSCQVRFLTCYPDY